jgi:hypothetical protein
VKSERAVTRIGWFGLGLSILAVALLFTTGWLSDYEYIDFSESFTPAAGDLLPFSLAATIAAFASGITVDIIAGNRGRGNKLVGILGGSIMMAPAVLVLIALIVSFWD